MVKKIIFAVLAATVLVFIACDGESTIAPTAPLASIEVTPADPGVAQGFSVGFVATGIYADGTKDDLTEEVHWGSSDTGVATISNTAGTKGRAETGSTGTTTISAALGAVIGSTTLTVTDAKPLSIEISAPNNAIALGRSSAFTATGLFSDASKLDLTSQAAWSSSDPAVATISNAAGSEGVATSVSVGTTTISAALGGVSGTSELTVTSATLVSIDVTPPDTSIANGGTASFSATGTYSDGSTADMTADVLWDSADGGVATISNAEGSEGVATSVSAGTTTITAALDSLFGSATLDVTAATLEAITLTPSDHSVANGGTVGFSATGTYSDGSTADITADVLWDSSDNGVATISNAEGSEGFVTSVSAGTTTITAALDGLFGMTSLIVTDAVLVSIDVTPGLLIVSAISPQIEYTATGHYSDGSQQDLTKQATWSSSDTQVATVSNAGDNSGETDIIGAGTTTIEAVHDGISGNTTLTVM